MRFFAASLASVHPHTRGEHFYVVSGIARGCGSSPHAWGTPPDTNATAVIHRFIPTRVGNPGTRGNANPRPTVHPHTRGEHGIASAFPGDAIGSSPHAWGTLDTRRCGRPLTRFIPTRVGNTRTGKSGISVNSVHPHTRGEHRPAGIAVSPAIGSSPHAWGTRETSNSAGNVRRFIPTRVGNTRASGLRSATETVHPHTRGEHAWS